jgi:hypothetical protein
MTATEFNVVAPPTHRSNVVASRKSSFVVRAAETCVRNVPAVPLDNLAIRIHIM